MAGLWTLLLLSTIMGGASFLAGLLPLSFSLSPRQLRLITALGTGVLVGTAIIVIIPEGVDTLYKASGNSHNHDERSLSPGQISVPQSDSFAAGNEHWRRLAIPEDLNRLGDGLRSGPDDGFSAANPDVGPVGVDNDSSREDHDRHTNTEAAPERAPHAWIGISIICGFILMYLIDTVPRQASKRTQPTSFPISLGQFSFNNPYPTSSEEASPLSQDPAATDSSGKRSRPSSTTVGLTLHAISDGIAIGASSTTSSNISFVIFIALLIHKHVTLSSMALCKVAPAAFGLTSVLLKQGLSTRETRIHLIIFSLAAPVGALLTWSAVHLLGLSSATPGESANAEFAVGCVLLFSGGTFLYVAMHTMQESGSHAQSHEESHDMDDPYSLHDPASHPQNSLVDTLVTVGGMLLPLLTQLGHSH